MAACATAAQAQRAAAAAHASAKWHHAGGLGAARRPRLSPRLGVQGAWRRRSAGLEADGLQARTLPTSHDALLARVQLPGASVQRTAQRVRRSAPFASAPQRDGAALRGVVADRGGAGREGDLDVDRRHMVKICRRVHLYRTNHLELLLDLLAAVANFAREQECSPPWALWLLRTYLLRTYVLRTHSSQATKELLERPEWASDYASRRRPSKGDGTA